MTWSTSTPLLLASASPRRRQLLALLGVPFVVAAADVDETAERNEDPISLATRLAATKALAGIAERPAYLILAADTVVALDGRPLGKPTGPEDARAMLRALRGRSHRVVTGVALVTADETVWLKATETVVEMRRYSDGELNRYVETRRGFDKAGGYAIQDPVFQPVARIVGCYPNVVGLPLCDVVRALHSVDDRIADVTSTVEPPCSLCRRSQTIFGSSGCGPA